MPLGCNEAWQGGGLAESEVRSGMQNSHLNSVRSQRLKYAFISAVVGRVSGVALQLVVLPMAAAALGTSAFSIFSMISAILAWIMLSNLGISQATTFHMAGNSSILWRRKVFLSSLLSINLISLLIVVGVLSLVFWTPVVEFLFREQEISTADVAGILIFVLSAFLMWQNLMLFEAAQVALQEQHRYNIASGIGTAFAALAVYLILERQPTVLWVLICVHVPVIIFRSFNAVLVGYKLDLRPSMLRGFDWSCARLVLFDGLRFASGTSISNFLIYPFSILVVGASTSALVTSSFAAVMNAVLLVVGMLSYFLVPLTGALPEARMRDDWAWIKKTYVKAFVAGIGFSTFPFVLFALFGEWLFREWYRGTVEPSSLLLVGAGFYIFLAVIEAINYSFLSSLGALESASRWIISKGVLTAVIVFVAAVGDKSDLIIILIIAVNIFCSLIPLAYLMLRKLRDAADRNDLVREQ